MFSVAFVAGERLLGAEHAVELRLDLLARVVELVDGVPVEGGADLDGAVVVGEGVREELLLDVLLAHAVRLARLVVVEPGDDLRPLFAAVAEGGPDRAQQRAEVGDDAVLQAVDLAEAAVLAQRVARHPGVGGALEVGVRREVLEEGAVLGVAGHRLLERGVLVARVHAEVVDGEGGERRARPGGVRVRRGVRRVHCGQDLLDQAELVLAQAGGAARVEGLAQGAGVGGGGVEGVGGGAEVGDGPAHRVDGGGVGDVDLGARVVVVGHGVQVGEHLLQPGGVAAVVGGGQRGYPAGDRLDVGVGHDGRQARVPRPDEAPQAAVGGDGLVAEEVGELLGGEVRDPVEGAGDARGGALGRGGELAALRGGHGGGLGDGAGDPAVGDLAVGDGLAAAGGRSGGGVRLRRVGEVVDLVERVRARGTLRVLGTRGEGTGSGDALNARRGSGLGGLGHGLARGGEEGDRDGGGEEGRTHGSVLGHQVLLLGGGWEVVRELPCVTRRLTGINVPRCEL